MKALEEWSLGELIDRVTEEQLVDDCIRRDDHVIIIQGTTRFVLDPGRAHAFLRGVLKGMSAEYRRQTGMSNVSISGANDVVQGNEQSGLFETFRRHLIKKWWGRYSAAGRPCGRGVRGLMLWIRYNTKTTTN